MRKLLPVWRKLRPYILLLIVAIFVCDQSPRTLQKVKETQAHTPDPQPPILPYPAPKGALLSTRFLSFEQLKAAIQIDYFVLNHHAGYGYMVRLTHRSQGQEVTSVMQSGVNEKDFVRARDGGFWDRVDLVLNSPYAVLNREDLKRVSLMSRRKHQIFTMGDVAFYDLAETMVCNISPEDVLSWPAEDMTEKGFINTFNHLTGQAFMTSLFSEKLADFIADAHELGRLPELITGDFTETQIWDLENGPVDNYVDLINNEWGQKLGKQLKEKHNISSKTHWTPELLKNYLNDVQAYYSWAFQISFEPYRVTDEVVVRFSDKINKVMRELSQLE